MAFMINSITKVWRFGKGKGWKIIGGLCSVKEQRSPGKAGVLFVGTLSLHEKIVTVLSSKAAHASFSLTTDVFSRASAREPLLCPGSVAL